MFSNRILMVKYKLKIKNKYFIIQILKKIIKKQKIEFDE